MTGIAEKETTNQRSTIVRTSIVAAYLGVSDDFVRKHMSRMALLAAIRENGHLNPAQRREANTEVEDAFRHPASAFGFIRIEPLFTAYLRGFGGDIEFLRAVQEEWDHAECAADREDVLRMTRVWRCCKDAADYFHVCARTLDRHAFGRCKAVRIGRKLLYNDDVLAELYPAHS